MNKSSPSNFWPIYPLFLLSGFPALLYQIVWQRSLFTLFGTNIESITLVVAAFMLGLGMGSLLGGRLSVHRFMPQLVLFGVIEVAIGLFGMGSLQLFDLVGSYAINLSYLQMTLVAFLLVFIPTLSMGATLPILSSFLVARLPNVGLSLGTLYFVNTLGSAIAAFSASMFLMGLLGMQGTIYMASMLNFLVGAGALLFYFSQRSLTEERASQQQSVSEPGSEKDKASIELSFTWILSLAFASGFIALSYEILWMRIFSFANAGAAFIFPRILGLFLLGLAIGSYIAGRICEVHKNNNEHISKLLGRSIVVGAVLGFLLIPIAAFLTTGMTLLVAELYLLIAALALGIPFPLLAHLGIEANRDSGKNISYMYMSNIAGATIGTILTGFVLMDYLSSQTIAMVLAIVGLLMATTLSTKYSDMRPATGALRGSLPYMVPRIGLGVLALAFLLSNNMLTKGNYERFQTAALYDGQSFKQIVETKSGVITVTNDERVYGGGVYDGRFNTSLIDDTNGVIRPFLLGAFHPSPKKVLMIGLATGSWAKIVAHYPDLEELVIVEINPGYREVVEANETVSSLLTYPQVELVIDDGRRYLQRHSEKKFDLIIMNTTFHWRAYAANLLSKEFLEIVLSHLNEHGIAFYNSTNSMNVQKTGAAVCPHSLRFQNHILCSNEPIESDTSRLEIILWDFQIDGLRLHDPDNKVHVERIADIISMFDPDRYGFNSPSDFETFPFERGDSILRRTTDNFIITDDNMGDEWSR